ncbi:MAG TPA: hypothetical protein VD706_01195 [Candidatus Saccharimonadales bacterium]|nr:hypothetical protein [Candidatus Saccharimonadales bacterium]
MPAGISCENDLGELMPVGTQEAKAIVLGGMIPGAAYTQTGLHRELFLDPQGPDPLFTGSPSTQMEYCDYSLIPAGCVQRVEKAGYMVTTFGDREGKAYAGHVLDLSLASENIGLRALYGMARTLGDKESLPPLDRLRIFRELLATDGLHPSDLAKKLDMGHKTVASNLNLLDRYGVVRYESIDSSDYADHIAYELPEDFDLDAGNFEVMGMMYDTIRHLIAEGRRQPTLNEFMGTLHERYPDAGFDKRSRRATAIGRLNKLAEAGDIGKNTDTSPYRSSLVLTEGARAIVERSVAIADGMLSGEEAFLEEGKRHMRNILHDEEAVRTLMIKAFRDSPEANGLPFEERMKHVIEYFTEHGTASLDELAAALSGTGMTYFSVKGTMVNMRKEGLADSVPIEGERKHRWFLVSEAAAA